MGRDRLRARFVHRLYAGAITMFEEPLQRWASPPSRLAAPVSMERAPELIAKVIAAHPETAHDYDIHLATGPAQPARMSWTVHSEDGPESIYYAALAPDGTLQVEEKGPSAVAQLVDVLHQQVGLPLEHEIAMPIMGAIALLYAIALVTGVIVLLPSLVDDLFAVRLGKNLKRMWLDVHNVLGVFSLPFHLIMAFTAVVFAFHDQFYDAQGATFSRPDARPPAAVTAPPPDRPALAPAEVIQRLAEQVPGFTPVALSYGEGRDGAPTLRVSGHDARYGLRGPTFGIATLDPHSGAITGDDYMPGRQDRWGATITSFFALHFGNYGGAPVRWAYFLLGLAGAFLFYSGNLLWVESRRKKERKAGPVVQSRSTTVMGILTIGVTLGCIAGISLTIAAAKWLPAVTTDVEAWHWRIYYGAFLAAIGWAFWRGAARGAIELLIGCAMTTLLIPLSSLAGLVAIAGAWSHGTGESLLVDLVALAGASAFLAMAFRTARRGRDGRRDSIWTTQPAPQPSA
jgi:uncharacterized iron-regulated membrane protein